MLCGRDVSFCLWGCVSPFPCRFVCVGVGRGRGCFNFSSLVCRLFSLLPPCHIFLSPLVLSSFFSLICWVVWFRGRTQRRMTKNMYPHTQTANATQGERRYKNKLISEQLLLHLGVSRHLCSGVSSPPPDPPLHLPNPPPTHAVPPSWSFFESECQCYTAVRICQQVSVCSVELSTTSLAQVRGPVHRGQQLVSNSGVLYHSQRIGLSGDAASPQSDLAVQPAKYF